MLPVQFDLVITSEAFSRWKMGRDGLATEPAVQKCRVPLPYLVFLRAQPVLGINFHEALERDPDRGLYGGVSYREFMPIAVGQTLSASSTVTDRKSVDSPRGSLTITTLQTNYSDGGSLHATETVRMIDLPILPVGSPEPAPAPVALREPAHPHVVRVAPISRSQVAWLTVETGDINALHFDAVYARQRNYRDVVVPATLINALIEREIQIATQRPVVEMDVRYLAPTFPDEALDIFATFLNEELTFQVFVEKNLRAEGRIKSGAAS